MKKISLLVVCVVGITWGALTLWAAEETTVDLRIEGSESTMFAGPVTVLDCVVADVGGIEHEMSGVAACALAKAAGQAGFEMDFKDFGFGLFLDRIGQDSTPDDFSKSWSFWVNDSPASVGVDAYSVVDGDELLLAFTGWPAVPLRVAVPEQLVAGETASFMVERRVGEYDDNFVWQGEWEAAEGATLYVGDNGYLVPADGQVEVILNDSGELVVQAQGNGLVRSDRQVVEVVALVTSPSVSPVLSPSPSPSLVPSPSPVVSPNPRVAVEQALGYLRSQQNSDGTIDGAMTSAWSAMAFGADYQRAQNIMRGGASLLDGLGQVALSRATDVERQIMAVRAAGVNPRSFDGRDLIAELKGYYRQGQFGEPTLINDDVFGILALLAVEEAAGLREISGAVQTVLKAQEPDGSWGDVDMTAAAVQALRVYADRGGNVATGGAIDRARDYLRGSQDKYGGWGENSASTSWAIQAIVALNEKPGEWRNGDGLNPWQALLRYQNSNGGFGWKSENDVSAFMTAYAVPALLSQAWPIDLLDFELVVSPSPAVAGAVYPSTSLRVNPSPTPVVSPTLVVSPAPVVSPSPVASVVSNFIPPKAVDRNFAVAIFGLANLGIGVAVARMILI